VCVRSWRVVKYNALDSDFSDVDVIDGVICR